MQRRHLPPTSNDWDSAAEHGRDVDAGCRRSFADARAGHDAFDFRANSILGATMRHQHAGLAIPDFPLAYGKIWPDTSADAVRSYNAHRMNVISENPITAFQIILQMVHRIVALAILVLIAACAWQARRRLGKRSADQTRVVLAGADSGANCARRGDHLVEQGRRRGDGARAGRRAFARDRRVLVPDCFPPFGGIARNCASHNNIRRVWWRSGHGRKQVK